MLESYTGKSAYKHHGQRVVMGQRLMQPASDIFLGWVTGLKGNDRYVRQLRDAKIKPLIETFNAELLGLYGEACGWVLARAHSKVSKISATLSGYLGSSSDEFDVAMGKFAMAYADQAEHDFALLKAAVRKGKIAVQNPRSRRLSPHRDRRSRMRMPSGLSDRSGANASITSSSPMSVVSAGILSIHY